MKLALYPGTFDPITRGHLDVLQRALQVFDRVEVTVAVNRLKKTLFTLDERVHLANASIETLPHDLHDRVDVVAFEGLLVDHARAAGAVALVRGLRQVSDFDYEARMAMANRRLFPELQTVFLMPPETQAFVSSSIVRDVHRWGGDVSSFVPPVVVEALAGLRDTE
ncbi:MAG: pantetheine-phosphate adenylyltransferase [Bacteroidota bacterium]